MIPAWTLRAWPPLLWQADAATQLHFAHLDTRVLTSADTTCPCSGQTLWVGPLDSGEAGMAWDWVQVARGVVAMADPMCVVTNLRLLGSRGEVLTALESARHLNGIVHMLPWQYEVQRALQANG
jgi:hypothetical protein